MSANNIHDYPRRTRPQAGEGAMIDGNGLVLVEDQNSTPLWHV